LNWQAEALGIELFTASVTPDEEIFNMAMFVDDSTKVVVQGITGRDGGFHSSEMLAYGTKVLAGVTPRSPYTTRSKRLSPITGSIPP